MTRKYLAPYLQLPESTPADSPRSRAFCSWSVGVASVAFGRLDLKSRIFFVFFSTTRRPLQRDGHLNPAHSIPRPWGSALRAAAKLGSGCRVRSPVGGVLMSSPFLRTVRPVDPLLTWLERLLLGEHGPLAIDDCFDGTLFVRALGRA